MKILAQGVIKLKEKENYTLYDSRATKSYKTT